MCYGNYKMSIIIKWWKTNGSGGRPLQLIFTEPWENLCGDQTLQFTEVWEDRCGTHSIQKEELWES